MIKQFISWAGNINKAKNILTDIESLVHNFTTYYIKDMGQKNALIDAVIEYLQSLKDQQK